MVMRSVVTFLVLVVSMPVWSQKVKKPKKPAHDPVLFSVNNREVTNNEFVHLYKKNHPNKTTDYTHAKIDEYLTLFINFKLKVEEARSRGLDTTQAFRKEYANYKEELRKPYLPEGKLVDSLVRLTYNRLKEEVRAAHLLIGVKPDATPADTLAAFNKVLEIKAKAAAGEDFGALAATYSEDPSARVNQGDLGYFTALQMVYPFESAAYQGKIGEIRGPVKTRFGYHLIKVIDRKPSRGEVEVSHIMIRTASESDVVRARNLIFEIHDQLRGGVAWEELCTQYSEDTNSKNNGGRLRPFGVGAMAAVPEFDAVAFSLQKPGDISDPFQTAYGWHIVRLEQKIPLPSYEELVPSLKPRVQRDERVQISRQALMTRLKKEFAFTENQAVKSAVFARADSSLTKGKWTMESRPANEVLFSSNVRTVPANEFIRYARENQRTTTQAPAEYIGVLYDAFVEKTINEAYEDKLVKSNPDYEMLLREYYEGILLFEIMEKEVWNKANEDTLGQRAYFSQHAGQYKAGERVKAEIYSSTVKENIQVAESAVGKGDTLALQELVKTRKVRLEKGNFQQNDRPVLGKIDWKPGDYSLENSGLYYLVRILALLPPGPMTFEEAKAPVIADYQNYLEKNWVEQLKQKYPVKINDKSKQDVYKQLARP
jgi:peptidyl-prolyl cis-trans isomerase SurA